MSNIPIFSYKQYLDDISKMTQQGTIGADRQAEAPRSAGSRGLKKVKDFIKDPVHMMGESEEGRPTPAQPNGIEEKVLDMPTPTIPELAEKHGVSVQEILDELRKGLKVEAEHTTDFETAKEIALDHLNEKLNYYEMLSKVENRDDQSMAEVFESWLQRRIPEQFHEGARTWFEAKYQGRTVPLGKPMRGDVKKFKVYVKDPKTGNVKKVNFGHGGTSAKRLGQKTMKIKKSNPKRRKSFRARHNCDNPGPRTKARYWSCRAW
jgi:hypothetical protein